MLVMLGRAAEQTGNFERALEAYRKVYYELPLSAGAPMPRPPSHDCRRPIPSRQTRQMG